MDKPLTWCFLFAELPGHSVSAVRSRFEEMAKGTIESTPNNSDSVRQKNVGRSESFKSVRPARVADHKRTYNACL